MTVEYPIGPDAVLYRTVETGERPEMWHVEDVYHGERGRTVVHVVDGTHTCDAWHDIEDVWEMYEPAGWQTTKKPVYLMTRRYKHRAYPKDLMMRGLYD